MALAGVRVLELSGLAPVPFCGMVLADFGADVVRLDRASDIAAMDVLGRGKRSLTIDHKRPEGVEVLRRLAAQADVLVEPFRPGVMERLGLGPDVLLRLNPRLIYARLTGFGQEGPQAKRAGHDINYLAVAGVLSLIGRKGEKPLFPCNLLADFAGGGMLCALGIVLALLERTRSGKGQVVDATMMDGVSYLSTFVHNHRHTMLWANERGSNLLDSGAPFYDTYLTKDGKYIAVGALEPRFYHNFVKGLGLEEDESLADQMNPSMWPAMRQKFTERFLSRTRDEWARVFESVDACVTPVLEIPELMEHPHNKAREFLERSPAEHDHWEPRPAPRLSRTPADRLEAKRAPHPGQHTKAVLQEYGFAPSEIAGLLESGVVGQAQASLTNHRASL